jgi:PAS domain S-box-containing protein
MRVNGLHVRSAIENGQLVPVFQPIVDLRTGLVIGLEVLARWNHPERGLILPNNFIRLAEQNGLIDSLTDQVLRNAFLAARRLRPDARLSINISPLQLRDRRIVSRLQRLFGETGMSPARVTVEITESAIIDNIRMASRVTEDLKAIGCNLSLDDFGTGYSSLIHLKGLPFDELKVDRSFVREIATKRESRKIVSCVVEMGHALGLHSVAEGVETEEQCELLFRLGCHAGQGWLYGRPLPEESLCSTAECGQACNCAGVGQRSLGSPPLRRAAAELAAQLNALYTCAAVGLCLLDTKLRYVSINRQLADMNGYSEQEHIGRTPQEMVPEIYPALEGHLRTALRGARTSSFEVHSPRGDGNTTYSVTCAPVFDEAAEMIGISAAVVDVTDRVRAERELQHRMEYYRSVVAVSPLMHWLADSDMNMVEVSPKWLELTGLSEEESLGLSWLRVIHPDDQSIRSGQVKNAMLAREPFEAHYRVATRQGRWRWMHCKGWPRFAGTGELSGWSGYLLDVENHRVESARMRGQVEVGVASVSWGAIPS